MYDIICSSHSSVQWALYSTISRGLSLYRDVLTWRFRLWWYRPVCTWAIYCLRIGTWMSAFSLSCNRRVRRFVVVFRYPPRGHSELTTFATWMSVQLPLVIDGLASDGKYVNPACLVGTVFNIPNFIFLSFPPGTSRILSNNIFICFWSRKK